jgi:hypothetical protein
MEFGESMKMKGMEYSKPKQIQGTNFYTVRMWDEGKKQGHILLLTKKNDKFLFEKLFMGKKSDSADG